jgi:hypothetical protein
MMKPFMMLSRCLKQRKRPDDIGPDERLWAKDRSIDMRLRSKVYNRITLSHKRINQ